MRVRALLGPTLDDWVEGEIVNHAASGKHGTRIWFIQSRYTLDFGDERGQHESPSPIIPVILLLDDGNDEPAPPDLIRGGRRRRPRRQSVSLRSLAHGLPQRAVVKVAAAASSEEGGRRRRRRRGSGDGDGGGDGGGGDGDAGRVAGCLLSRQAWDGGGGGGATAS